MAMGCWNYRVMRYVDPSGNETFGVHEVHYSEGGEVEGWTENPTMPSGETLEELKADLANMLAALEKPVLEFKDGKKCLNQSRG